MKTLILGANGQLGSELTKTAPSGVTIVACDRAALDITDVRAVSETFSAERPQLVINAAAYTAVDQAESEPELAQAVNAVGAGHVAAVAAAQGARLVHISTDFVFDGAASRPYSPDARTHPLSVYGKTKRDGEEAVRAAYPEAIVLRTAWLYADGGKNFVSTMLRLMGEGKPLRVVADQVGSPTWARTLAEATWALGLNLVASGIHHWTDAGIASWYDFAVAIQDEALSLGLLERPVTIEPIASSDYPTPARRPAYSVLDCHTTRELAGVNVRHWRHALKEMLTEVR
jgi:dTDP-4-dehydrorhamnose reductase